MKDNLLDGEYLITKDYTDWHIKTGGFARDMTLRDYFAAKAMQEFIHAGFYLEKIAGCAYEQADAMLKERAK